MKPLQIHPPLAAVLASTQLNQNRLTVVVETAAGKPVVPVRGVVPVSDGTKTVYGTVPSLRELFRGDKVPPHFGDAPPPEYMPQLNSSSATS